MIRTVIVDDEPLARDVLREYLAADEDFEIAAECANGFEAVRAVTQHDPDVLFLDIQMPKLDGFEVLSLLDRSPVVVFVTAHDEYALRAFEVNALDYLLKPFSEERFHAVLQRLKQQVDRRVTTSVAALGASLRSKPLQRIDRVGHGGRCYNALMRSGEHEVARAYVLYREKRAEVRAQESAQKKAAPQLELHVVEDGVRRPLDPARLRELM